MNAFTIRMRAFTQIDHSDADFMITLFPNNDTPRPATKRAASLESRDLTERNPPEGEIPF